MIRGEVVVDEVIQQYGADAHADRENEKFIATLELE
jgi:hypothetical protein